VDLEYERALDQKVKQGRRVLPWFVGSGYEKDSHPCEERMRALHERVLKKHTVSFFDSDSERQEDIAQAIVNAVVRVLWSYMSDEQKRISTSGSEGDLDLEELYKEVSEGTDVHASDDAIDYLARRETPDGGVDSEHEALERPAYVAAYEQYSEGREAIRLGEHRLATKHLEKALRIRPLDVQVNYWLAKQFLATELREDTKKAKTLALRSMRLAEKTGQKVRAAAAAVVAAQAFSALGETTRGLELAQYAKKLAEHLAFVRIELGAQWLLQRDEEKSYRELRNAFLRNPESLYWWSRDRVFSQFPPVLRRFRGRLHEEVRSKAVAIERSGAEIRRVAETDFNGIPEGLATLRLLAWAKREGLDQIGWLTQIARSIDARVESFLEEELAVLHQGKGVPGVDASLFDRARAFLARVQAGAYDLQLRMLALFAGGLGVWGVASSSGKSQIPWALLVLTAGAVESAIQYFKVKRRRFEAALELLKKQHRAELESRLVEFERLAGVFETSSLVWRILSPSSRSREPRRGEFWRLVPREGEEDSLSLEEPLAVPPRFGFVTDFDPVGRKSLARVIEKKDGGLTGSRWRCYWEVEPKKSTT